jgi:hypothetical protein
VCPMAFWIPWRFDITLIEHSIATIILCSDYFTAYGQHIYCCSC